MVPIDHFEVVCNGEVAINVPMTRTHDASDAIGALHVARSGWCLLRAWAENARDPVLDSYPYATTSPIYITVDNKKPASPEDAKYFLAWVDRVSENAKANTAYRNEAQKAAVLTTIEAAHTVYDKLAK
jgi:TolB protein